MRSVSSLASSIEGRPLKLAVGAISRAAVDAACDVAAYFGRPIYILASRAQVGSFPSRPGYADGWCMEDLTSYLLETGRRPLALVIRDHGGPLQDAEDGPVTELSAALTSACDALAADVGAGADGVHLDLGAWRAAGGDVDEGLLRLTDACERAADGHVVDYEIGVDAQSAEIADPEQVKAQLEAIRTIVPNAAAVAFVVVQCGTLVDEDRNVGMLQASDGDVRRKVEDVAVAAQRGGVRPKAHNCDYLSPWALRTLGRAGVYCNIAPQYAVHQNRLFARMLDLFASAATKARVTEVVAANGGWRKWTRDCEKPGGRMIELGAHYAMSSPAIHDCVAELDESARRANLPGFEDLTRRTLRQLMRQHASTLEGVTAPCH